MSESLSTRRWVCNACGHVQFTWAARCAGCTKLDGLSIAAAPALAPAQTNPVPVPSPTAAPLAPREDPPSPPETSYLRFVRPRAPSPEPELSHEELLDTDSVAPSSSAAPVPITEIAETTFVRDSTGLAPLDHVLGGGLVEASIILLAAPPGLGKTSLTLQMLVGLGHRCLYVTGEETTAQLAGTGRRIGAVSPLLYVHAAYNLEEILAHATRLDVKTMVIDSIQKMACDDIKGEPGSPGQVKACSKRLVRFTKNTGIASWIIGQVTSDGDIAGPRAVEHDVDVVLELEPGPGFEGNERILRCPSKNRFGPTGVEGRFELTGRGFIPIDMDGWNEKL